MNYISLLKETMIKKTIMEELLKTSANQNVNIFESQSFFERHPITTGALIGLPLGLLASLATSMKMRFWNPILILTETGLAGLIGAFGAKYYLSQIEKEKKEVENLVLEALKKRLEV